MVADVIAETVQDGVQSYLAAPVVTLRTVPTAIFAMSVVDTVALTVEPDFDKEVIEIVVPPEHILFHLQY